MCSVQSKQGQKTHTHTRLTALCPGLSRWASTRRNIHPLTPILYQLPLSTMIHSMLLVQFVWSTVLFHNLSPGPLWSSSWPGTVYFILHTFLCTVINSSSFFHNTCPYHRSLLCCNTSVTLSIPNLSLSYLLGNLSFTFIPRIHLTTPISAH